MEEQKFNVGILWKDYLLFDSLNARRLKTARETNRREQIVQVRGDKGLCKENSSGNGNNRNSKYVTADMFRNNK